METNKNLQVLFDELEWLEKVIHQSICTYLMQEGHETNWLEFPLPDLSQSDTPYGQTVTGWNLKVYDRLALALGLATHLKPEILDVFFGKNQIYDRGFTEFGGAVSTNHSGFLPTGQTLCFLAAASSSLARSAIETLLSHNGILIQEGVLSLTSVDEHLPRMNGVLYLSSKWFQFF